MTELSLEETLQIRLEEIETEIAEAKRVLVEMRSMDEELMEVQIWCQDLLASSAERNAAIKRITNLGKEIGIIKNLLGNAAKVPESKILDRDRDLESIQSLKSEPSDLIHDADKLEIFGKITYPKDGATGPSGVNGSREAIGPTGPTGAVEKFERTEESIEMKHLCQKVSESKECFLTEELASKSRSIKTKESSQEKESKRSSKDEKESGDPLTNFINVMKNASGQTPAEKSHQASTKRYHQLRTNSDITIQQRIRLAECLGIFEILYPLRKGYTQRELEEIRNEYRDGTIKGQVPGYKYCEMHICICEKDVRRIDSLTPVCTCGGYGIKLKW